MDIKRGAFFQTANDNTMFAYDIGLDLDNNPYVVCRFNGMSNSKFSYEEFISSLLVDYPGIMISFDQDGEFDIYYCKIAFNLDLFKNEKQVRIALGLIFNELNLT